MSDQPDNPTPAPTQTRYPGRATMRTIFAVAVVLLPLLPEIADALGVATVPAVAAFLAGAAGVTRVLAMPRVDQLLRKHLPWLAAEPKA